MMEMLTYDFMQRAFLAGGVIALVCPVIGLFLVLRRLSMVGDTLAHVSMAGVAAALIGGVNAVLGALVLAVSASLGMEYLRRFYRRYAELAAAIMLSAGISTAVILIGLGRGDMGKLTAYLFGSIVTLSTVDVFLTAGLGVSVLLLVILLYKELFYLTYDEESARVAGVPVELLNCLFMIVVAVTVAITMRIVGILLVSSMMVLPAAASLQLARSFRHALLMSVLMGEAAMLGGLTLSYYLSTAPGGTVIMVSIVMLAAVLLVRAVGGSGHGNQGVEG